MTLRYDAATSILVRPLLVLRLLLAPAITVFDDVGTHGCEGGLAYQFATTGSP